MKILILRFSSIGDIVLTTPVIRCMKKRYPDAEIHYATKKAFHTILQHNPYIRKIHLLGDSVSTLLADLKKEKFDYVIDLHNNQRTFYIKARLGVKSFSFNKLNFEKWLLINFKINWLPKVHIVDRYLQTCKILDVANDGLGLDYFLSKEDEINIEQLPLQFQKGYAAWVIGAKHNTKKFPLEKIIHTLHQLQMPVVLLGGPEDVANANRICAVVEPHNIFNACGKYSLNQSASLVQQSRAVIANDTGLMHIAAAFKKPLISIWGNTVPEFGMTPYYGRQNIKLEVKDLPCRPCSKLGYHQCPKKHFKCMHMIDEEQIIKELETLSATA